MRMRTLLNTIGVPRAMSAPTPKTIRRMPDDNGKTFLEILAAVTAQSARVGSWSETVSREKGKGFCRLQVL